VFVTTIQGLTVFMFHCLRQTKCCLIHSLSVWNCKYAERYMKY